ncbi:beta-ketoacyl-[acyl-carrier-protein] synthase family protein [Nocardia sp. NPDC101769]|uniref:beta-ketoacyl-[acyl-carrier-protein] synthase family protein n=1 Tax=Nocardia sp. NPDC101769 TaxID=3364333 RepID=UPI0037F83772
MSTTVGRPEAVITGIGSITPVGRGVTTTFDGQCEGRSGIVTPPADHEVSGWLEAAGVSEQIRPIDLLRPPIDSCIDRYVLLALAAADDAIADAGLIVGENVDPLRVATIVSSGGGGLKTYEEQAAARRASGKNAVNPYLAPGMLPNMASARIAIKYGLRGYSSAIATACAAGGQSIADGLRLIREGEADVVVCGGSDAPLHPTVATAFSNTNALARNWKEPHRASRPFDTARNGFVLSEGAAVVILERTEHADARGAAGYGTVLGWGMTTDGYHIAAPRPDGDGAAECMRRALTNAGLTPADITYVNAHGTSTKLGDTAESRAIRAVFGTHSPAVSATKSVTGHTLGAAGAVEAAVTAISIARGMMPPTINLDEVDSTCDLDHVTGKPRLGAVSAAISNSFGFGGHNVSLVFGPAGTRRRRFADA